MKLKKYFDSFIENPIKLLVFLIIVNLLPSIGLIFTEPFDVMGKVVLILFPIGLYLALFTILRNIGLTQLILIPLLVIHAFQIVVFYLFGEGVIASDMFLNVVTTNMSEAGEVLQGIIASVIFVILVYVPTIVIATIAFKRKVYLAKNTKSELFVSGLALMLVSYGLCFLAENKDREDFAMCEDVYPIDVFYNLNFARQKWQKSSKYKETSKDFSFNAHKEKNAEQREIYVLVIGETSRPDNWGLYGYERNTTPLLQQDSSVIFFNDVITQSNTTHKSVSIMLTSASAENYDVIYKQKSLIEAFKEVGFSTVFLSNQSANRTLTDYFSQEADHVNYYRFFNEKVNNLDEIMLPKLQEYIDSIQGDILFVVHSYGSHFNYRERYSSELSVFKPDNFIEINKANRNSLINAYDNTILYTDKFLHSLINILEKTDACTSMLYVSDHGEDILDDRRERFLHASPNPTIYQLRVPLLMWFSPVYEENYPLVVENTIGNRLKPVSTNSVFHTLLDVAHIKTDYLNSNLSLISNQFKVAKRMYLNDHDKPTFFYKAGLKEEDRIVIDKKSIHH